MKKVLFKLTLVLGALAMAGMTTSCGDDNKKGYDPIDATFESPRSLAAYDGSIYVTCYSPRAVVRIDTATMKPTGICELGNFNPEGIAVVDGKLYIASNSISDENYNYTYDDKVYVVDAKTMEVVTTIQVGKNAAKVVKVDGNHVAVNCWGDNASDMGGTYLINTNNNEVVDLEVALYNMVANDGKIYGYTSPYGNLKFYMIDGSSHNKTEIFTDWNATYSPYGISINPKNGDVVVLTGDYSSNGDCFVYTKEGAVRMEKVELGMLPSKAAAVDANTLLVINEGSWGGNNASLSRVDVAAGTADNGWFSTANGRGLGDVAQDIMIYGKRAYVTVTFSNSIEAVNVKTGQSTRMATAQ